MFLNNSNFTKCLCYETTLFKIEFQVLATCYRLQQRNLIVIQLKRNKLVLTIEMVLTPSCLNAKIKPFF